MHLDHGVVLITGASAGIGREFARLLAPRADTLVLVARREDRLEDLANELKTINPRLSIHFRATDLNETAQIDLLGSWLQERALTIDLLINNAGLGDMGAFTESDLEKIGQMLAVNVSALTRLTRLLLPAMIAQKRGGILNVSSSAGFVPIPGFAVYAATKAYVNSFSEALRAELRGTGVSVCALCPGPVHTEFTQVAQRPGIPPQPGGPEFIYVSPRDVAAAGLETLEQDRPMVIPGAVMKTAMAITRLTPIWVMRLFFTIAARRRGVQIND